MPEEFEKLSYEMLGDDSSSQQDKLSKYMAKAEWKYLEPHFRTGNLIFVDPGLDLKIVATAFLKDDKIAVEYWKKNADIVIPSIHHAQWWEHDESCFITAIVQPFILIQPLAKTSE